MTWKTKSFAPAAFSFFKVSTNILAAIGYPSDGQVGFEDSWRDAGMVIMISRIDNTGGYFSASGFLFVFPALHVCLSEGCFQKGLAQ